MKISVIVPVFNVEKYLRKCIDSILNQTLIDLEVILVDDGSKDLSGVICDEYKKTDQRVVVIHKENGGLSSARNSGIEIATGEFISFIDSDDWIEPDYLELLLDGITLNNSDISVLQFSRVKDFSNIEFKTQTKNEWICLEKNNAMKALFEDNLIGYSAVNKMYKKYLFNKIRFPESFLMEDKATIYKIIDKSNYMAINYSEKYHYYLRNNSIIRSKFNKNIFDSFIIHNEIIVFIDINYPELSKLVRGRYVHTAIRVLIVMMKSGNKDKRDYNKCEEVIKKYIKYAVFDSHIRMPVKLLALIFYIFPFIPIKVSKYQIVQNILRKINIS